MKKTKQCKTGKGFFIRDAGKYPPQVRSLLSDIGDKPIISITLVKTPLDLVAKSFSSIISLGKFGKVSKKYFDEIYHVSMWINNQYNLEKLSVVSLTTDNPIKNNSLTLDISLNNNNLTYNKLLDNTRNYMGNDNFSNYDPEKNNCQVFLLGVLNGNNIGNEFDRTWIKQDTQEIFNQMSSFSKTLGRAGTKLGAIADRLRYGENIYHGFNHSNELSNNEIYEVLKKARIYTFHGCFSKDTLPRVLKQGFYIVNAQSHDKGNGTHWCAFYYNYPQYSIWFDPFGFIANENTQNRIIPYIFNDKDLQDINATSCGFYCIAFIKFLHDKRLVYSAFDTFLKMFKNDTKQNELILHQLLKNYE